VKTHDSTQTRIIIIIIIIIIQGLRHYATGRKVTGSRPDEVNNFFFSIYLILPAALGPGIYSASDRNEYQKQKNNVSGA
jgi:hypothetical protein